MTIDCPGFPVTHGLAIRSWPTSIGNRTAQKSHSSGRKPITAATPQYVSSFIFNTSDVATILHVLCGRSCPQIESCEMDTVSDVLRCRVSIPARPRNMPEAVERNQDSYVALATVAIMLTTFSVILVDHYTHTLEARFFHAPLTPGPFIDLVNGLQVLLVSIVFVILGSILHRYPEPYFILWFFGWASWLLLYLSRLIEWRFTDLFNGLNSYFFFLAGASLAVAEGTKLSGWITKYPARDLPAHLGGAVPWLGEYFWMNWRVLLPLPFMLAPVWIEIYHKEWAWPTKGLMSKSVYLDLEVFFSVLGIGLLGFGLYRRFATISRPVAVAAIVVHAVYLQPQLAKAFFDLKQSEPSFGFLFEVLATSVACKPALALFATLLALTETEHQMREAEQQRLRVLDKLPAACVVVRENVVQFFNERASRMFGLVEGHHHSMAPLFECPEEMQDIIGKLGRTDSVYGCYAFLKMANGGYQEVRIDAFRAGGQASEIIFLILDRHDRAFAEGIMNYVHSGIKARLLSEEEESSAATSKLINVLLQRIKRLEKIWHTFWEKPEKRIPTRSLWSCIKAAYAEEDFRFDKPNWPNPTVTDYEIPSLPPERVKDIFKNIFSNIDKHAYGNQKANLEKPVAVTVEVSGDLVVIRVTDKGEGFPEDVVKVVNGSRLIGKAGPGKSDGGLGLTAVKLAVAASAAASVYPDGMVRIGNNDPPPGGYVEIKLRGIPKHNRRFGNGDGQP